MYTVFKRDFFQNSFTKLTEFKENVIKFYQLLYNMQVSRFYKIHTCLRWNDQTSQWAITDIGIFA